jgi:hypothetical protein
MRGPAGLDRYPQYIDEFPSIFIDVSPIYCGTKQLSSVN